MVEMIISEIERNMLLKLSVNEKDINNNILDLKEKIILSNMRKCMAYLNEKYPGVDFTYLHFSPEDWFNDINELVFKADDGKQYTVYYDANEDTIKDNFYTINLSKRYDEWLYDVINKECSANAISKVKTDFGEIFGAEITGNEQLEDFIAMKSKLGRDTDVIILNANDTEKAIKQIKDIAYKYGLYGCYRVVIGERELAYFNTFDIE